MQPRSAERQRALSGDRASASSSPPLPRTPPGFRHPSGRVASPPHPKASRPIFASFSAPKLEISPQTPKTVVRGAPSTPRGASSTPRGGSLRAMGGSLRATGGSLRATGGSLRATGGSLRATGGSLHATGGSLRATGGSLRATGGSLHAMGGSLHATGGSLRATGEAPRGTWEPTSAPPRCHAPNGRNAFDSPLTGPHGVPKTGREDAASASQGSPRCGPAPLGCMPEPRCGSMAI
jgi:hypothetical protein